MSTYSLTIDPVSYVLNIDSLTGGQGSFLTIDPVSYVLNIDSLTGGQGSKGDTITMLLLVETRAFSLH